MKKGTSFFYIFISIICLAFCACKIELEDTELVERPEASAQKEITIVIPRLSKDTDYINLYRMDISSSTEQKIGVLYPSSFKDRNYYYIDEMAFQNHTYKYKARYHSSDGYHYSEWSNEVTAKEENQYLPDNTDLNYTISTGSFTFNNKDYNLTITNAITDPTFDGYKDAQGNLIFKPMLIVSNSSTTQLFEIPLPDKFDTNGDPLPVDISDLETIQLRSLLPLSFQDTEIKIEGILAQKNKLADETNPNSSVLYTIWTPLTSIPAINRAGRDNTLTIKSQKGSAGVDYSRSVNRL